MVHPAAVCRLQENYPLNLTDLFCLRELRFFLFIQMHGFFLKLADEACLCDPLEFLPVKHHWLNGDHWNEDFIEFCQVPFFRKLIFPDDSTDIFLHQLIDHADDIFPHIIAV